jgi:hypothetical protein
MKSRMQCAAAIGTLLAVTVIAPATSFADRGRVFGAGLVPTPPGGMSVEDLIGNQSGPTPGNVGVCLSGGASRALSAGMGQLRALKHLTTGNGLTLLEQTKALSAVSGGSWVGVPFSYLGDSAVTDDDFLNLYVSDPGRLVPTSTPGHTLAETLDEMPAGNIGANVNQAFSGPAIALQVLWLFLYEGVPAHMLWQTVVGLHMLSPYGLFLPGRDMVPRDSFAYDQTSLDSLLGIPEQNRDLASIPMHLLAGFPSRLTRPYAVCNTSMFVQAADPDPSSGRATFQFLAPVQSTPFFTGIVGSPQGLDANGKPPGGGGVSSFAFNSSLLGLDEDFASSATIAMPRGSKPTAFPIHQHRPFSLMDAVGASSAFYAELLQNLFTSWGNDFSLYLEALDRHGEKSLRWVLPHLKKETRDAIRQELNLVSLARAASRSTGELIDRLNALGQGPARLRRDLSRMGIKDLVPAYRYWPVLDAAPQIRTEADRFADGGNLENTGVNALLSYTDIDALIAFVNSPTALQPANGDEGQLSVDGQLSIHTNILVDSQIPPLFGYQPYDEDTGAYVLYQGAVDPDYPQGVHSQSFPAADFPDLLRGLWSASGDGHTNCPNFLQEMPVLENEWFGIAPRERVSIIWVYTNFTQAWFDELSAEVQQLFQDEDLQDFPHYSTFDTGLSSTQVNLLANLTAWCVADEQNSQPFIDLFMDR